MKVCVLQPDYSTSSVDYQYYDPARNLSPLLPGHTVDHVLLNKLTTYKQLKELAAKQYDIYVNLCEGYLEWEVPSIDVIFTLELLDLPFTGPTTKLYDPSKELMKYLAFCEGVQTPGFVVVNELSDIEKCRQQLKFPLFVKPAKAGDSLGIDHGSLVNDVVELGNKCASILPEFTSLLVEEYVDGREFTVLVAANADGQTCTVYKPVEYVFPEGHAFKTYALKTSELHPDCNVPCNDPVLEKKLRDATERIFQSFNGVGYARLDFRVDSNNAVYFLEINFTCSVFYQDGYEGSADYILMFDGIGQEGFLKHIIKEGISRHARKRKPFVMQGNAIAGYGIYANREINSGEIIFKGEGRSQRLITKRYVDGNWNEEEKLQFRRYAYPVSQELFILWDDNPTEWAPQNHSCNPNTAFDGLNVVSLKTIHKGEELTLDYAQFLDEHMEPFECRCGAHACRGTVTGIKNNSLSIRERAFTPLYNSDQRPIKTISI